MPIYWPPDCYSQLAGKGLRFEGKPSKYQIVVVFFLLTNGRLQPYCDLVGLHHSTLAVSPSLPQTRAARPTKRPSPAPMLGGPSEPPR